MLTWSCGKGRSTDKGKVRHIILVSIDTCRADHLGCYGYQSHTTPNIDAVAQQAVLFENAISPVPLTLPAHTSMLSGTVPAYHGVHDNIKYKVSSENLMLPEILQQNGFTTAAFVSSFVLDSQFGMDQGFGTYQDEFEESHSHIGVNERSGEEVTTLANQWLEQHHDEKFFLFLHYYDPHTDYRPPEPYAGTFADSLYDGEIAYVDHCISRVIGKLKQLNLYDSSLLIITADHGEGLGQHRENEHSFFIYQSTQHVPLVIKPPLFNQGKRIKDYVGLIDIAPTILGALGISPPETMQGKDLAKMINKNDYTGSPRYFLCESFAPTVHQCNRLLGIVGNGYKYIQAPRPELYYLKDDPGELNNIIDTKTDRAKEYRGRLGKLLNEQIRTEKIDNTITLDNASRQRLESLGYVESSSPDNYDFDPALPDAKDFIDFYRLIRQYKMALDKEQFRQAQTIIGNLLQQYPQRKDNHYRYGYVANLLGNHDEAIEHLTIFLKYLPDDEKGQDQMAEALYRAGRYLEAIKYLEKVIEFKPQDYETRGNLGYALNKVKRYDEAVAQFQSVLQHDPKDIQAHTQLALAMLHQKKYDEAITYFQQTLELDPDNWQVYADLGLAQAKLGRFNEALACWQDGLRISRSNSTAQVKIFTLMALQVTQRGKIDPAKDYWQKVSQLEPDNITALYNLGLVASHQDELTVALSMYKRVLELNPEHLGALNNLAWILATGPDKINDPIRAVELAEKACQLEKFAVPDSLDTLAVAYAAVGQFEQARQTANKAIEKALIMGNDRLVKEVKVRLKLYENNQPYRVE